MSDSVETTLLLRKVNLSTSFRELLFNVETTPINAHEFLLVCVDKEAGSCSFQTVAGFRLPPPKLSVRDILSLFSLSA